MLTITDAQIEALQRSRITAFAPELEAQLHAVMPDIVETRLQTGVATALRVAHENRVSDARDLAVLALIVVTHGPDFLDRPEQGWATAILRQVPTGRDTRIFQIHARLRGRTFVDLTVAGDCRPVTDNVHGAGRVCVRADLLCYRPRMSKSHTNAGTVTVDGTAYDWHLHSEPHQSDDEGWKGMTIALLQQDAKREALVEFPPPKRLLRGLPRGRLQLDDAMIARCVRSALSSGWEPVSRGRPVVIMVDAEGN